MSAYGHQIEREYSARSLSSREEESETGSQFRMESVIYMSSCAATIFISSLVIVGILLITLLTTLTVMLQSCQSREAGLLESHHHHHHHHRYDYCKMAALNAEINGFKYYSLPELCKDVAIKYIKEGHYMRELNNSVSLVADYFNGVTPDNGGHDVVLFDIDDLLSTGDALCSNSLGAYRCSRYGCDDWVTEARHMKHVFLIDLYIKLQSGGWPLILLSRKPEKLRATTVEGLTSAGCAGWLKLILRSNEEMKMDTRDYFSKQIKGIQADGYHIKAVISSYMDALLGEFIRTQHFKLPNHLPVDHTQRLLRMY